MFDFTQIMELAKVEPGHNLLQCLLLFMIWISSRGLKKELVSLKESIMINKVEIDTKLTDVHDKLVNHETRIVILEKKLIP